MEDQICSVTTLTGFTYAHVCNVRGKSYQHIAFHTVSVKQPLKSSKL